jgi:hypothetical protein
MPRKQNHLKLEIRKRWDDVTSKANDFTALHAHHEMIIHPYNDQEGCQIYLYIFIPYRGHVVGQYGK